MDNLKLKITSEKNVSIDDIVKEADDIWRYIKLRKLPITDDNNKILLDEIEKRNPQFSKAYPIVKRYMCEMRQYNNHALRFWLKKISTKPWKTEEDYLAAHSDYPAQLYRITHRHCNMTEVANVRNNVYNTLMAEHKDFKLRATGAEKYVAEKEKLYQTKSISELQSFAQVVGEGVKLAETFRIKDVEDTSNVRLFDAELINIADISLDTKNIDMTADDLLG